MYVTSGLAIPMTYLSTWGWNSMPEDESNIIGLWKVKPCNT